MTLIDRHVPVLTWTEPEDQELDARTACPAHRTRLSAPGLRRGALCEPLPDGWAGRADLGAVSQPILGLHGTDDQVSPFPAVRLGTRPPRQRNSSASPAAGTTY
jgi:hypothetical protein